MNLSGMPQAETVEHHVTNDGFYPDLNVAEFVDNYAVASPYAGNIDMIVQKLSLAIVSVNKDLTIYRRNNWLNINALAEVPSKKIDNESHLVMLYKHAVFSLAKANLLVSSLGETHRDRASVNALENIDSQKHWVRQSNDAIFQIVQMSRTLGVELI